MKNQMKTKQRLGLAISLTTGALVVLFLSGKVIDLPRGTTDGGIIGAAGVAIIIFSMIVIGFVTSKLIRNTR